MFHKNNSYRPRTARKTGGANHPASGWVRANEAAEGAAPEILDLKRQIEDLRSELTRVAQQPPAGSEQLAQGDDEYELDFEVEFEDSRGNIVWEHVYYVPPSWNTIFRLIAPTHD